MNVLISLALIGIACCTLRSDPSSRGVGHPIPGEPLDKTGGSAGIKLCILRNGELVEVDGLVGTGQDTLIGGQPVRELYAQDASGYAAMRPWFKTHAPIVFGDRLFYKNAPPLRFRPDQLLRVGEFGRTPLFVEAPAGPDDPAILYVLLDASCLFQAYYRMN